nr:MAG TPA: hypothetical protein [Caudoviricetes sp.]
MLLLPEMLLSFIFFVLLYLFFKSILIFKM